MKICEQQPVLETIPEKEVQRTPAKEAFKSHMLEDCHSTDEGTFASPSSCTSDEETSSSARCADSVGGSPGGSPGPSSSCTSDDEQLGNHSGQEADVDSCESSESGLNSSCASDDEDDFVAARRESDPAAIAKLPSVGSVGHYIGQCSRCCFFPKGRCTNGENCNFCHLDHERVRRKRGGAKKAAKAAEDAENSTLEPKELFKDEQGEQAAVGNPPSEAPKEAEQPQVKVPVAAAESVFPNNSMQAKGEVVMHGMANIPMASMQVVQPIVTAPFPLAPKPRMATPQCPRSSTPIAEQLTSKLLSVSAGRPVKVWLPRDVKPLKLLDNTIPAKKRPSFEEYVSDKKKTLDPNVPCKKHMPSWLANLDAAPAAPMIPTAQTFAPTPQTSLPKEEPAKPR